MSQSQLKKYVLTYLADELAEVRARGSVIPPIDEYESAIIIKYTNDGYVDLNEDLRIRPEKLSEFGEHLKSSLMKLPSYKGLAYRGVTLTARQLKLYEDHLTSGMPVREQSFLSTSRRRTVAMQFGIKPVFVIRSKNGRLIENYAKYGIGSPYNESEVIFLNSSTFIVADISKENDRVVITMFEV
jgi:hypothetical protein